MAGKVHRRPLGNMLVLGALIFWLSGCVRSVTLDDPALKPFASMYAVDRERYGMSPLPNHGQVVIDRYTSDGKSRGYDVMLSVYNKATHYVAFRLENGTYRWVGEQEECQGPRRYRAVDGTTFNESLTISYFHQVPIQAEGLRIAYRGPEDALLFREVPIPKAKELLKQWGCE